MISPEKPNPVGDIHGAQVNNMTTNDAGKISPRQLGVKPEITLVNIPVELRDRPQWVAYRAVPKPDGKTDKIPVDPATGRNAKADHPETWGTFEAAVQAAKARKLAGVGYEFSRADPFTGIDLDTCVDPATGAIEPWAQEIVNGFASYTERSRSGKGLHVLIKGKLPPGGRRKGKTEMYDSGRFFVTTGDMIGGCKTIEDRQAELNLFHTEIFGNGAKASPEPAATSTIDLPDDKLIELAKAAKNGDKFNLLWTGDWQEAGYLSQSQADQALCNLLAFWTGRDETRMDLLFRESRLYREKWDREDYPARTIKKAIDGCTAIYTPTEAGHQTAPGNTPDPPKNFNLTDLGNAERLVAAHGADVRFCHAWGKWLTWDGTRWAVDDTGAILRLSKAAVRRIYAEASSVDDDDRRKALVKHARGSEAVGKLAAMATLAQSEDGIPVRPDDLDRDPWAVNVQNGTVDLRTGELRTHARASMISKLAPVVYDPAAKCPHWMAFLERITAGRESLIEYLQKAIGWALTGIEADQTMWILHGTGANGKTILTATIGGLLGDYAVETPVETLMIRKTEGIPNDIARLKGARLVTASEGERGQRLAESLIKRLTGGDKVSARFLHGEYFEFVPVFKLWLSTNHKPVIRGTEQAIWNRIHLVPFDVTIPPAERIPRTVLMDRLRQEWPGILAWAVEGCLKWQREGLQKPEEVEAATEGYREEMDILGGFLADCCVLNPLARVNVTDFWAEYEKWCETNNEELLTKNTFKNILKEHGIKPGNVGRSSARGWHGIGLRGKCGHADMRGHVFQGFSYEENNQEKKGSKTRPHMSACPQNITCTGCGNFQPNPRNPSLRGTCTSTPHDGDPEQYPKLIHECGHFQTVSDADDEKRQSQDCNTEAL